MSAAETTSEGGVASAPPPQSLVLFRLEENIVSCSASIERGDQSSVLELVNFLDSVADAVSSDPESEEALQNAFQLLTDLHQFLSSPSSLDQAVMDGLSLELPKTVARFAGLSDRFLGIAETLIDVLVAKCNPRDLLPILCEALDLSSAMDNAPGCVSSLLTGIAKVLLSIQRRHYEQVKVAVPIILKVVKDARCKLDDRDMECINLFNRALGIADSICSICGNLEGIANEKLRALLGLYVLQVMALLSLSIGHKLVSCLALVSQLSSFIPYCGLSYLGLITGSDVDSLTNFVVEEEDDHYMGCLSYTKHGAALSVIWGHMYDEVAQVTHANMSAIKDELRNNQSKRWEALGMLKHILSTANLPWEFKRHSIDFVLSVNDGNVLRKCDTENTDCSIYMPSLFAALQAIIVVIIHAPRTMLKKDAFEALKRVLADIPTSERLDMVQALISNSDSPSMIAILLDIVRQELHIESQQRKSMGKDEGFLSENQQSSNPSLWTAGVLKLVELVLRPPKGGPPSFPEQSDAVLAALNLYRFVLMTESAEKTNCTGVLSKDKLLKAYNEWLLPLRTLVSGVMAENKNDYDQIATDIVCAVNPVELVLYRCIELVEEKLYQPT